MNSPLEETTPEPGPYPPQRTAEAGATEDPTPGKTKGAKKKKASRGVETLFRTTLSNHIQLSEMADRKANLMISINTIIISIVISPYFQHVDGSERALLPSLLLVFVSLVTIIVAMLATKPTVTPLRKGAAPEEVKTDLLFFGDYTKLTADDYRRHIRHVLSNDELLYTSLIDSVYAQGLVLSRKYRLLKFAYQFFMVGFSLVVVSYVVSLLFFR